MLVQLFTIPITDNGSALFEMNSFLQSHKVLNIDQYFYPTSSGAMWCFCVAYIPSGNQLSVIQRKTDYKEILSEAAFKIFSRLRSIRKEIAINDAVPAYAVFTDAELADISKLAEISADNMKKIPGIAEKRMNKYGNLLIEKYLTENNEKAQ
jgi:superfamily II DNA helicase RecQ